MNKTLKRLFACVITASMLFSAAVIPQTVSAEDTLPTDGLLMDITFDEAGTGTGSFNATLGGLVKELGSVSYSDSHDGKSKALNISSKAANNYLELPDGLLQGCQAATFSFWLKPTSNSNPNWAFMNTCENSHAVNTEKYIGMLANSETHTVERYNNNGSRLSSVSAQAKNDWQYITVSFERTGTKLYINGILAVSDTVEVNVPALFTSTSKTWIGHANWGSGEGFAGMIDDFKIYGRALNENEVQTLAGEAYQRELENIAAEKNYLDISTKFYTTDRFSYNINGNNVDVTVPSSNSKDAVIIAAAYTMSTLSNVVIEKNITLKAGVNTFSLENVKKNDSDTIKVFVWDSLSGVNPIPDISTDNVFQFDAGSHITVKTTVTNYTTSVKTITCDIWPYDSNGNRLPNEASVPVAVGIMGSYEFSDTIVGDDSVAYYKVVVSDISGDVRYNAGILPKANVSFPDATPPDTIATTHAAHDPSIFKDPKTGIYYAYNSGNAYVGQYTDDKGNIKSDDADIDCFRSADLVNWERIDCNFRNPESAKTHINTIFAGRNSVPNGQSWAPDILYVESDKEHPYWLYYSLSTTGTNSYIRSVIGLVKGESPTGPWTDCGVVISSEEGYNTNAIDSNIYTDTNGDRYLVWGSYQRGIHQLKLREDGLAEGIDYTSIQSIHSSSKTNGGTRLFSTPNGTQGPEGPWMINNTDTNYRYMFVSCGWLSTTYNVRVARNSLGNTWASETSSSAHHKLLDHMKRKVGTTFTEQTDKSTLWGYKVIGSYQLGDGITYYGNGHNSVLHDDDGNWYLVEHCRKQMGGYANLQVRKMLWNEDGWPVVSPLVYAGEKEQEIPMQMIAGTWDLSSVGRTILDSSITSVGSGSDEKVDLPVLSSKLIFALDNGVYKQDGACVGEWSYDGDHTVTVEFTDDGDEDNYEFYQDGDTMTLYVLTGYDKDQRESALVMTGTDQNNVTQFAKKDNAVCESTKLINQVDTSPVTVAKSAGGNPIVGIDAENNITYGGDPSVLVDGDTVYLYAGHDTSTTNDYVIPEYLCYSSKDLKNWTSHGSVFAVNKDTVPWARDSISAWAGQVLKHNGKYYLYYCTWANSSYGGYQCIGVAESTSPTGPFTNKSTTPLINGQTMTTENTSTWNDIDPTGWIETDENGNEHIYLNWGNTENYTCELNSDMVSVKDINGDGKITSADIKHTTIKNIDGVYTEAPYLYRRTDENGKYTGKYYLFFAKDWREQWAYATTDDIMGGSWDYGSLIMGVPATSNTSHGAIFDFDGKTYYLYHNGSLPGGSGHRRVANIQEMTFDENGNVNPMTELSIGLTGTASKISADDGKYVGHEVFTNPLDDASYPLVKSLITTTDTGYNAQWEILPGKSDSNKANYVSIQSVDKPGLYICTRGTNVILTQQTTISDSLAEKMTFETVEGINGKSGTVSFKSVAKSGYFITVTDSGLKLTDGSDSDSCSFTIE